LSREDLVRVKLGDHILQQEGLAESHGKSDEWGPELAAVFFCMVGG